MAQIFFSENPREREQLKGGIGVSDRDSFDYGRSEHTRASHPYEWAYLLRWRLQSTILTVCSSYVASTGISLSASPTVASQFTLHLGFGSCPRLRKRECRLMEHVRAFTQVNVCKLEPLIHVFRTVITCHSLQNVSQNPLPVVLD